MFWLDEWRWLVWASDPDLWGNASTLARIYTRTLELQGSVGREDVSRKSHSPWALEEQCLQFYNVEESCNPKNQNKVKNKCCTNYSYLIKCINSSYSLNNQSEFGIIISIITQWNIISWIIFYIPLMERDKNLRSPPPWPKQLQLQSSQTGFNYSLLWVVNWENIL